jgi:hypothetical protein
MKSMRQKYAAPFKAKLVLEAIKGERTLAEIAGDYQVHPNQITKWKKIVIHGVFSSWFVVANTQVTGNTSFFIPLKKSHIQFYTTASGLPPWIIPELKLELGPIQPRDPDGA